MHHKKVVLPQNKVNLPTIRGNKSRSIFVSEALNSVKVSALPVCVLAIREPLTRQSSRPSPTGSSVGLAGEVRGWPPGPPGPGPI